MKYAAHVLASTLILVSLTAAAQLSSKQKLVTQVPFQFTVANNTVPAGECLIERANVGDTTLIIHNRAGKVHLVAMAMADETPKTATHYSLTFRRYGDLYFLTGIRVAGTRSFYKLPVSSRERELQIAHAPGSDQIVLASLQ